LASALSKPDPAALRHAEFLLKGAALVMTRHSFVRTG
jgi:hypothetical protein